MTWLKQFFCISLCVSLILCTTCSLHPGAGVQPAEQIRVAVLTFTSTGSIGIADPGTYAMQWLCQTLVKKNLSVIDAGRVRQIEALLEQAGERHYSLRDMQRAANTIDVHLFVFGHLRCLTPVEERLDKEKSEIEVHIRVVRPKDCVVVASDIRRLSEKQTLDAIRQAVKEIAEAIDWMRLLPDETEQQKEKG
jgi:hypothetical protein